MTKANFTAFLRLSGRRKRKFQKTSLIPEINPLLLTNCKNRKTTTQHFTAILRRSRNTANKFQNPTPIRELNPILLKNLRNRKLYYILRLFYDSLEHRN